MGNIKIWISLKNKFCIAISTKMSHNEMLECGEKD